MRASTPPLLLLALSGLVAGACGDDGGPSDAGPDVALGDAEGHEDTGAHLDAAQPDLGRDAGETPLTSGPCEGALGPSGAGGAAGPNLAGQLLVHVIDEYDRTPRAGAKVRLQAPERLVAETDLTGCVQFVGSRLRGAVTVSAFESGRSFVTVVGQTRRELTLVTSDPARTPPTPTPGIAFVSGVATNLEVLTATSLTSSLAVARVADLRPITKVFTGGPPAGAARAGYPSIPRARAYVGPLSPTDPAPLDLRDLSIAFVPDEVLGFWLDGGSQRVDLTGARIDQRTHLGMYRDLRPEPGQDLRDLEFELTAVRDQTLAVRVGTVPSLFTNRVYLPFVSFPEDNGIVEMDLARPYRGPSQASVPALEGPLEGAVYGALFIATTAQFPGPALRLVKRSPSPDIDFGNTPPPPRVSVEGRRVELSLDQDGGSMAILTVAREGRLLWLIRVLEPRRVGFEFDLADVPEGLVDMLAGSPTEVQIGFFRFEPGVSAHELEWLVPEMERRTTLFSTDTIRASF